MFNFLGFSGPRGFRVQKFSGILLAMLKKCQGLEQIPILDISYSGLENEGQMLTNSIKLNGEKTLNGLSSDRFSEKGTRSEIIMGSNKIKL